MREMDVSGERGRLRPHGEEVVLTRRGRAVVRFKSTSQGEARRKQIEKVVVDGDYARLTTQPGEIERLAKTQDGWKIAP